MSCIYKVISLVEGETFVLPPGAELVGASDVTAIDSTCPLPELETPACYATVFGEAGQGAGDDTTVYNVVLITGLRVDNILYNFSTPFTVGLSASQLADSIDTTVYGAIITDIQINETYTVNRGTVQYVVFKTIPSITNDMYFVGSGTGHTSTGGGGTSISVPVEFKVMPYSVATSIPGGASPQLQWPACTTVQV